VDLKTETLKEKLFTDFAVLQQSLNGKSALPFNEKRKAAMQQFSVQGFPNTKIEEWRHTNIAPVLNNSFKQIFAPSKTQITKERVATFIPEGLKTNLLVFVNGFFSKELSSVISDNKKILISTLAEARISHPDLVNSYFTKHLIAESNSFILLNEAFTQDGAVIQIPESVTLHEPVYILNITEASTDNTLIHPHNIIITGKNSTATIIENYHAIGDKLSFTNAVTEIFLEESAHVNYYKIQDLQENEINIGTTQVVQQANSLFNAFTISAGARFIKNNLNSIFSGERAEAHFYGLYISANKQLIDNHTLIDHAVPNCYSNEFYKGIIADNSNAVFNGRIIVRKDAQKTNAFQSNRNILLSDEANIFTKPQLEIFADDVKCTHGATVGQLDDEALFYLRARGLSENSAKSLLLRAFASDILEKIKIVPLRHKLEQQITGQIGFKN
jgi:Fe-S cluster assembly protein SufD